MRFTRLAPLTALLGCVAPLGPGPHRVVGVIEGLASGTPAIELPDTVRAGEELRVTIHTTWRNTCARADRTEVVVDGLTATITPYDRVTEGVPCGAAVQRFTHVATLRFPRPGSARVVVRGRPTHRDGVRSIERPVTVR